jgi:hypothetical protein
MAGMAQMKQRVRELTAEVAELRQAVGDMFVVLQEIERRQQPAPVAAATPTPAKVAAAKKSTQ